MCVAHSCTLDEGLFMCLQCHLFKMIVLRYSSSFANCILVRFEFKLELFPVMPTKPKLINDRKITRLMRIILSIGRNRTLRLLLISYLAQIILN